jgi:hypothetical protein
VRALANGDFLILSRENKTGRPGRTACLWLPENRSAPTLVCGRPVHLRDRNIVQPHVNGQLAAVVCQMPQRLSHDVALFYLHEDLLTATHRPDFLVFGIVGTLERFNRGSQAFVEVLNERICRAELRSSSSSATIIRNHSNIIALRVASCFMDIDFSCGL